MKPKGRQAGFEKLRAIRCFEEMHERVRGGWPLSELARWIQEDKEEYQDVTRQGLLTVLKNYRASIPPGELVAKRLPKDHQRAMDKLEAGIDEVNELEELYRLQMERVKIDATTEKAINKLLPSLSQEIKEARSLLESLAGLKQSLGINSRAPEEHNVNIGVEVEGRLVEDLGPIGSEAVKKVMESPESRRRVTGVVDRFLRMSERKDEAPATVEAEAE